MNFITALELGKVLDLPMPERIDIIAVEAGEVTCFGERCTREVEQAIPVVVEMVLSEFQASGKKEG
jgi:Ni,Fe-hydrogenase maturation factor